MNRLTNGLIAGLLLTVLAALWPFGDAEPRTGDAQIVDYLYEVLPGLHDGRTPIDLSLTTGWHRNSAGNQIATDMDITGVESNGLPVYASFRSVIPDPNVKAWVTKVVSDGIRCSEVVVEFYYGNTSQPLGEVSYLHVSPSVEEGDEIPVTSGAGTRLGALAPSPWLSLTGPDAAEIIALAGNVGAGRIKGPYPVEHDGVSLSIIRIEGGWYRLGPLTDDSDGSSCASTAAHLHQAVSVSSADQVWRNVDRSSSLDDDGFGFPNGNVRTVFCADTPVYRLQSSRTAPLATPVEPCDAPGSAPSNLTASAEDGALLLDWADPADASITGYRYRVRLTSATSADAAPWGSGWTLIPGSGAATTSYRLSSLTNDTAYTVQLRAVNGNSDGPVTTVTETPYDPNLPPTIGQVTVSGMTLTAAFQWDGAAPRSAWWELHRSASQTSGFSRVAGPTADSTSPVEFQNLLRGQWYKVRGRTCESPSTVGRSAGDTSSRSPTYVATSCGDWSAFSEAVRIATTTVVPPVVLCDDGTAPPCDDDSGDDGGDGGTTDPPLSCTSPQVPNDDGTACVDPPLSCTSPQVPNDAGTACVDPPLSCTSPQVPNNAGTACVDPPLSCTSPQVPNNAGTACVDPPLSCTSPQVLNDAGTACVDPPTKCETEPQPASFTTMPHPAVITYEYQWTTVIDVITFACSQHQQRRSVRTSTTYQVSFSCSAGCWVSSVTPSHVTSYGSWSSTGVTRPCGGRGVGDMTLSGGRYEFRWNDQRIAFTVPAGASVTLSSRQLDNGDYVAVLTLKEGTELVIGADALDGDDQARTARFSSTTDPTLRSIADSLRDPSTDEPQSSVTTSTECAVAEASDDGTTSVNLDADSCVIVRDGGSVTVSLAGEAHALSLATGREWLIIHASDSVEAGTTAATFLDIATGGHITLSLVDGAELARHIPEGDTDLAALFDAMRTVPPSETSDDG